MPWPVPLGSSPSAASGLLWGATLQREAAETPLTSAPVLETGIPLWDELKSFFGELRRRDGRKQYVVLHCRGDRLLDLERAAAVVGGTPQRLIGPALEGIGMAYGLVSPFEPWELDGQLLAAPVLQVFDRDLLQPVGVPGTVMTNAGDLTWSVEIYPTDLANALDHTAMDDISIHDPEERPRPPWATKPTNIGIITGNGPESGMLLWRMVNETVREHLGRDARGDVVMPRVLVRSLPELGLTMELDRRHRFVWPALRNAAAELCRDGAGVLAIACNTTPYFTPELRQIVSEYGASFLSMPEVVGGWLRDNHVADAALVGVKTVADLGPWSPYREPLEGIEIEIPDESTMARIHELAYAVKAKGARHTGLNQLRTILNTEVRSKVVILALTEISLLLELQKRNQRSDRLIVDTMRLYADAIAGAYLGQPVAPSYSIVE